MIRSEKFKQLNEAIRYKGQGSGGHYHKIDEELFYVMKGKVKVKIFNIKTKEKIEFVAGETEGFIVEPYELHDLYYIEDTVMTVLHSLPFDKNSPDIYKYDAKH